MKGHLACADRSCGQETQFCDWPLDDTVLVRTETVRTQTLSFERRDQRAGGILEPSHQTMLSGLLVGHAKGHALAPFLHNIGH